MTATERTRNLLGIAATMTAAHFPDGGFDAFVERLTEAEDALDEGDEAPANTLLHDLAVAGYDAESRERKGEKFGVPAYTEEEKGWMAEPRRTSPRPPTLFGTPPGK